VLNPLFVNTGKPKETIYDWEYNLQNNLEQFKEEIIKLSVPYNLEDDNTCLEYDDCPITKEMKEEERRRLCKKCFEDYKENWCNEYKRAIDIAIGYFKIYFKTSKIRKDYTIIPIKQNKIDEY